MAQFEIREVTADDALPLADCHRASVDVTLRGVYPSEAIDAWVEKLTPAKYRRMLDLGTCLWAAFGPTGLVLGFGGANPIDGSILVYTHPDARRLGIGKELMHRAETLLKERGFTEARLESTLYAEPFYHAIGWESVERQMRPIAEGHDLLVVIMRKALA